MHRIPKKTDGGQLISSYECDPKLVEEQFAIAKREYLQKTGRRYQGDVIAYQIRQAFKPEEITPEEANRIGYGLRSTTSSRSPRVRFFGTTDE